MKTLILLLVCLFTGLTVLFSGCSEKNSMVPIPNNEISLKSKKIPTQFTGTCIPLSIDDGIWYDEADDERVTGLSLWAATGFESIDDITNEITGTAEIYVGAKEVGDDYVGKWEMTWKVTQTLTSPDGSTFKNVGHGFGKGVEGAVLGLTARWKYTMDFNGTPESFVYVSKGKITEEL